jgi:hypothetical protein
MSVEGYVSSARTFSLVILVLGYVGWDLGTQHSVRASIFAEARTLVTAEWVRTTFRTDRTIVEKMIERNVLVTDPQTGVITQNPNKGSLLIDDAPLGTVKITMLIPASPEPDPTGRAASPEPAGRTLSTLHQFDNRYSVDVDTAAGRWSVSRIRLADTEFRDRLHELADDTGVTVRPADPSATLTAFESRLYRRKVSVPSIDFASFHSEQTLWLIDILCVLSLVVLRSRVRMIGHDPKAGLGAPWLVLDASAIIEKIIAALWIGGILLSTWIVTGALLFTEKDLMLGSRDPPAARTSFEFLFIAVMTLIGGWASLTTVSDLLRLRAMRIRARAEL